jgi:hypothetical protein
MTNPPKYSFSDYLQTMPFWLLLAIAIALLLIVGATLARGQTLPLGQVTNNGSTSCKGFQQHAECVSLTISNCGSIAPWNVTLGTVQGSLGKTVMYANGSEWTAPGGSGYLTPLAKAGYTTVSAAWLPGWQDGSGNLMESACGPATLFNYVANGGQIALIAASGGAGAAAYAVSWYGLSSSLSGLWITSGPVYSDLGQGCEIPKASAVTVTPSDGGSWTSALNFMQGTNLLMTEFTGQPCEPKSDTTSTEYQLWEAQSILAPGAQFPSLYVYAQLCANAPEPNNSTGQGSLWLGPMGAWTVAISGCSGSEGTTVGTTPEGVNGQTAVVDDLEGNW